MRETPTAAEERLFEYLLEHLRESDPDVRGIEREVADRPDIAVMYKGMRIACECTQIPPSDVFQWVHRRLPTQPDATYCAAVVWAEEPHSWVSTAVSAKSSSIGRYRDSISADEVWLLVHTPMNDSQIFVRGEISWEAQMLRYGACVAEHEFDRVLFWEPRSGLQTIYLPGDTTKPVEFDLSDGYPTRSFVAYGGFAFTTTREGEPPQVYEYGPMRPEVIIVPPVDPGFIDLEPKFRGRSYKVTITAYSDRADSSVETIWDDEVR